jgi:predicted transcriptional regulator
MTVREIAEKLRLSATSAESGLDREVGGGIVGDLLSVVMSQASKGDLWITVQCHPNVVAVAALTGLSGIVVTYGYTPEPATLEKARQEGVPVLTTTASSFEVAGRLYELGVR